MKYLVSAVVFFILSPGSVAAAASAPEGGSMTEKTSVIGGELARTEKAVFQKGWVSDVGDTHSFWVLGGGLVALSLVARRKTV